MKPEYWNGYNETINYICPDCDRSTKVIPGGFFDCQLCENDAFHRRHSEDGKKNCPICITGSQPAEKK